MEQEKNKNFIESIIEKDIQEKNMEIEFIPVFHLSRMGIYILVMLNQFV